MNDTRQMFKVESENGEIKDAELLTVFTKNDIEYAIYAIDNGDETAQLFASRILTDENGEILLSDIENNKEKEEIIKMIKDKLTN